MCLLIEDHKLIDHLGGEHFLSEDQGPKTIDGQLLTELDQKRFLGLLDQRFKNYFSTFSVVNEFASLSVLNQDRLLSIVTLKREVCQYVIVLIEAKSILDLNEIFISLLKLESLFLSIFHKLNLIRAASEKSLSESLSMSSLNLTQLLSSLVGRGSWHSWRVSRLEVIVIDVLVHCGSSKLVSHSLPIRGASEHAFINQGDSIIVKVT